MSKELETIALWRDGGGGLWMGWDRPERPWNWLTGTDASLDDLLSGGSRKVEEPFGSVFCQVVIGQCGVSFPSEKAVGFSPVRNWPVIARVLLFHCIRA